MGSDQALDGSAAVAVLRQRAAHQHHFEYLQQLLRNLEIGLVASMMERDQDFVCQSSAIARRSGLRAFSGMIVEVTQARIQSSRLPLSSPPTCARESLRPILAGWYPAGTGRGTGRPAP